MDKTVWQLAAEFSRALDGPWIVTAYTLEDDGQGGERLRIHYQSLASDDVQWSHCPGSGDFADVPKVGTVGKLGFIYQKG